MGGRHVLRRPWQFRHVYDAGKKANGKYTVLFYHETGDPEAVPLIGVVASKRVGGAVERNRAKRLLREAVRDTANRLIRQDLWVVLVAKKGILQCSSRDVAQDLQTVMMGEGLIRGKTSA
jgi:ribonuclease P protein component